MCGGQHNSSNSNVNLCTIEINENISNFIWCNDPTAPTIALSTATGHVQWWDISPPSGNCTLTIDTILTSSSTLVSAPHMLACPFGKSIIINTFERVGNTVDDKVNASSFHSPIVSRPSEGYFTGSTSNISMPHNDSISDLNSNNAHNESNNVMIRQNITSLYRQNITISSYQQNNISNSRASNFVRSSANDITINQNANNNTMLTSMSNQNLLISRDMSHINLLGTPRNHTSTKLLNMYNPPTAKTESQKRELTSPKLSVAIYNI